MIDKPFMIPNIPLLEELYDIIFFLVMFYHVLSNIID